MHKKIKGGDYHNFNHEDIVGFCRKWVAGDGELNTVVKNMTEDIACELGNIKRSIPSDNN